MEPQREAIILDLNARKIVDLQTEHRKDRTVLHLTSEDHMRKRQKREPVGPDLPSPGHVLNRPRLQAHDLKRAYLQETPERLPQNPPPSNSMHLTAHSPAPPNATSTSQP